MNDSVPALFARGAPLWLLSDIHANATALESALDMVPVEDPIVFMGDLLTYGCHPLEVLSLVTTALEQRPAILLWGNHDALYTDFARGEREYYDRLPPWLQESVQWTWELVAPHWSNAGLAWRSQVELGDVLLSHANPNPPPNWAYVDTQSQYRSALQTVSEQGFRVGVFGHTHRPRTLLVSEGQEEWFPNRQAGPLPVGPHGTAVFNVGSLGQPRDGTGCSVIGKLRRQGEAILLSHQLVSYDVTAHLDAIGESSLSRSTQLKLLSYFGRDHHATSQGITE